MNRYAAVTSVSLAASLGSLASALLLSSVLAGAALAAQVFHSPGDNQIPGTELPAGSGQSLFLYIFEGAAPSLPGTACNDGQGDELCGYELVLSGVNGLTLSSFTPDVGANIVANLSANTLRLNGLDTVAPIPGAQRIGTILVDSPVAGRLELTSGEWIGADLSSTAFAATTIAIAVPEPSAVLMLAAGVGLLRRLRKRDRSRGRRAARRHSRAAISALALFICIVAPALRPVTASAASLIVNEFNAVSGGNYLNFGNATTDGDGNSIDPPEDTFFGRIAGNGGDWIELVVVGDHLDIRGWSLEICANGTCDDTLVFSQNAVWSDLRAGTILTVSEDQPTDLSFTLGSDWWMNVRAHNGGSGTFITADNFPVNELDWNVTILDANGDHIFGPLGEHVPEDPGAGCFPPQDDLNSGEIFRLEQAPNALIDPCFVSLNDWEDGVISTYGSPNQWNSGGSTQSFAQLRALAPFPDRDGDQIADDGDLSGVAGDNPCVGGNTVGCDDNCAGIGNPGQDDGGGPGGPDGQGDLCQCGDPTGDDDVTAADVTELREQRVGLLSELTVPERCSVHSDGQCTLTDLVVLDRTLANPSLAPGLAPSCQEAAVPPDMSDLIFDPDRLIKIDIELQLSDWDQLRFEGIDVLGLIFEPTCGDEPWPDAFTWYMSEVTVDGQTFENVGLRKKGFFGSLSDTEPSFKVKFDHFVGGQQIGGMDRFTLNNNLQDDAQLRSCLSYFLMRKAGVPAPRCNFAHVTVTTLDGMNEVVQVDKIYSHVESIKDPFLRRNFGSDQDQGRLYEGTLSDFWPGSYRNTIAWKTLSAMADMSEIDALMNVMTDNGLTFPQRQAAIEALVDLPAFLTFWAAEGITGHWDGYADDTNNFWFYVDPADGLIRFIPWGPDATFGPGNLLPGRGGDPDHAEAIVPRASLPRRLFEMPVTKALYLAELQRQLDDVFDEAELIAEIDRIHALISPVSGSLTTEMNTVKTWINEHRALVQAEITTPPTPFSGQTSHFCIFNP